ncbi:MULTISPECIES: hypothetical protein [Clostridium]|uniref:Uncharacterized protein n=1 Tax=Clostridium frigoriphilum TaxID=443253 RepID=A0ABU7ULU0_9CLOT|nr:hypothetical protein [Clostridium sp. DSM 17811]MBU3099623.1 hypothetical protein [Clostridium sp. DSM 17811]
MKKYLEDHMQGMPQMSNMCQFSQTNGMSGMLQMMYMQSMYNMMCMQNMYYMMNMYPMMNMDGMGQMMGMNMQFPIPKLVKLEQISSTQIQITYDRDVDVELGMKPTNYWIKDIMNSSPQGIATLGRNDNVNAGNSLTSSMVKINSMNGSAKTFILTFNQLIPRGAEYMLIICYVTVKGAPPYSGDNGMAAFIGK